MLTACFCAPPEDSSALFKSLAILGKPPYILRPFRVHHRGAAPRVMGKLPGRSLSSSALGWETQTRVGNG